MEEKYSLTAKHRRTVRLQAFDYADPGYYAVTICTQDRKPIFGHIIDGRVRLSRYGWIADRVIRDANQRCKHIRMYAWIVMPDHAHLIVNIQRRRRGTPVACPDIPRHIIVPKRGTPQACPYEPRRFGRMQPGSIPSVIAQMKSIITKRIRNALGGPIDVWQRNYYERVIRNEQELFDAAMYIKNNPRTADRQDRALRPVITRSRS